MFSMIFLVDLSAHNCIEFYSANCNPRWNYELTVEEDFLLHSPLSWDGWDGDK